MGAHRGHTGGGAGRRYSQGGAKRRKNFINIDFSAFERYAEKLASAAPAESDEDEAYITEMIAKRAAAKKAKNFAEADAIRDELKAKGILLVDSSQGTTWKRA